MVLEILAQGQFQKSADAVMYLKENPQAVQGLTRYKNILRDLKEVGIPPKGYEAAMTFLDDLLKAMLQQQDDAP